MFHSMEMVFLAMVKQSLVMVGACQLINFSRWIVVGTKIILSESISKMKIVARLQRLSLHLLDALDLVQLYQKMVQVVLAVMAVHGTVIQLLVNAMQVILQHHMSAGDDTQSVLLALVLVLQGGLEIYNILNCNSTTVKAG